MEVRLYTAVFPIFLTAGQRIKKNHIMERVIRQVDVTPTAAILLGVFFQHTGYRKWFQRLAYGNLFFQYDLLNILFVFRL